MYVTVFVCKFIDGYLGNLGRHGEKNREGMWGKKKRNLGEFLSNLSQGLLDSTALLHGSNSCAT